jgi:drug/metabolite transporter (DMT)-like permease
MTRNASHIKAHLALLGANLFYGAGFTVAKTVMPRLILPFGFILIRVAIVTLLFWLTALGGSTYHTKIQKKDWPILILGGLFGVALNQMLFFYGLNLTMPIHASLIMMSTPLLITIIAALVLKVGLTWEKGFGLLLGIGGAALLMTAGKELKTTPTALRGDLAVLLNAASYAVYLVIIKPLMGRYRPVIVVRWVFLFGLVFVLPFGMGQFQTIDWSQFRLPDYEAVAFIVICCTFFTYLWNIYALRILSPSTAGAYIYLQPLFAAVISVVWLGEGISLVKVLAAALIFTGVYLVNFGVGKKRLISFIPHKQQRP